MEERTGHLGIPGKVAGAAAVLLVLDLLISWYDVNSSLKGSNLGVATSHSGPGRITGVLIALFAIAIVVLLVLKATGRIRRPPLNLIVPVVIIAGLLVLLVLFRLVNPPGTNTFVVRDVGVFLGLLLALVAFVAAFVEMRQEGLSTAEAKDQAKGAVQERGHTTAA